MFDMSKNFLSFVVTKSSSNASTFQKLHMYVMQEGNYKFVSFFNLKKEFAKVFIMI